MEACNVSAQQEKPAKRVTKPTIQFDLVKVEELASQGLTFEQIAMNLGVSYKTIQNNKRENADFAAAIERGKAAGIQQVANSLFKAAAGGHIEAAKFYLARRAGWSETIQNEHAGKDGGAIQIVISKDDEKL